MSTTPYARLLVSLNGGAAAAGGIEATASDDVDFVYESTIGWPSSPAPYLEIYEAPVGWSPVPSTGWIATDGGGWKYYGTAPPPTIAAPASTHFGKVACQLVVGGGLKDGVLSADMTSGATVLVRSASVGLESTAARETTEFDAVRSWIGALQRDLRLIEASLAGVSALTEAQLRAVSATLTAALPVNGKKITGLANGSASSDAAAFGQIASAVNAAVSGTTNTIPKIASANTLGDSGVTDDGTTVNTTRFVTCTKSGIGTTKTAGITAINATNSGSNVSPQIGWTVYHSGGTQLNSGFQMAPLSSSTGDLTWYFGTGAGAPSTKHVALTSQNSTWGSGVEAYGFYVLSGGLGGSGLRAFGNNTGGYTWDSSDDALLIKSYNTKSVKIQTGADSGGTGGIDRLLITSTGATTWTFNAATITRTQWGTVGVNYRDLTPKVLTTTDATVTNAITLSMADNSAAWWEVEAYCYIVGDAGKHAYFHWRGYFNRNGGAPVRDYHAAQTADQVIGAWGTPPAIAITAGAPTTNDVSVQVTGLLATTIKWTVIARYHVTTTSA